MSQRDGQDRTHIAVSLAAALLVHGVLAGGLGAAEHFGWMKPEHHAQVVEMVILPPPPPPQVEPPPPPPPPPEEKLPPPPPPKLAAKLPPPRVAPKLASPPVDEPPPVEPPPPGPAVDDAPVGDFKFDMPASADGMAVKSSPNGTSRGTPGAKGNGAGGGGPPESTTPRVVSVASLKKMPEPDGVFDNIQLGKDYPADAKRLGIEGLVQVRILVDDKGHVARTRLLKGLGYGLDERALALAKTFKFKPALDTNDQPVATEITWSFHFELPE